MPQARFILNEPFKPARRIPILGSSFLIGRAEDCHLRLQSPSVSSRHARVHVDGGEYAVEDLGSKNGTFVNGRGAQESTLAHRDVVALGEVSLIFELVEDEDGRAESEDHFRTLRTALQWTTSLRSQGRRDPILDQVMAALMRLTQADRGFLLLENEDGRMEMVRTEKFEAAELEKESARLSTTAIEKVLADGQPAVVSDATDDTLYAGQTSVIRLSLKSLVCVPLKGEGDRVFGLLYADSRRGHQFAELDVEVLQSLAANAALAIENASLSQDLGRLIRQTNQLLCEVEGSAAVDCRLRDSVWRTLDSIGSLRGQDSRGLARKQRLEPAEG